MQVRISFITEMLGTLAGKPEIAKEFILSKHPGALLFAPPEDEEQALPDVSEEIRDATTFFPRDTDGCPIMWDYMVRGHFKAACEALINSGQWTKEELKKFRLSPYLYKKTIDQLVFVSPRKIRLLVPEEYLDKPCSFVERPLRATTMKGDRVALARSESLPAGTTAEFEVECLNNNLCDWVKRWLDYGKLSGYGQWRNGSYGRFTWELL